MKPAKKLLVIATPEEVTITTENGEIVITRRLALKLADQINGQITPVTVEHGAPIAVPNWPTRTAGGMHE